MSAVVLALARSRVLSDKVTRYAQGVLSTKRHGTMDDIARWVVDELDYG